jgi:acetyltransferase-like isoleucine patch superfamily enzyme
MSKIIRSTVGRTFSYVVRMHRRVIAKSYSCLLGGAFSKFGPNTVITPPLRFGGLSRIEIGSGVYIGAGSWIAARPQGGGSEKNPLIMIGDRVSISGSVVILAASRIVIEEDVLIALNVYIADHSHGFSDLNRPVRAQPIDRVKPVIIRSGAWLGQNVVICPGVIIGHNSVIGANSVVRTDIPDYCVAAGAPARVIRRIEGVDACSM